MVLDRLWYAVIGAAVLWAALTIVRYVASALDLRDVLTAFGLGFLTLARVMVLIADRQR